MTILVTGILYLMFGTMFAHRVTQRLETLYPQVIISRHSTSFLLFVLLLVISVIGWPILMGVLFFRITSQKSTYVLLNKYTISDELRERLHIVV